MINVIRKDLSLMKISKVMMYLIVIPIIFSTISTGILIYQVNKYDVISNEVILMSFMMSLIEVVFFMYIGVASAIGYDEKNKSDIILNSFPTNRSDIIISKYICLLIYFVVAAFIVTSIPMIADFVFKKNICLFRAREIIIFFLCGITICSILIPLYYKFGYVNMKYVSLIFYLLIFSIPTIISKLEYQGKINIVSLVAKIGNDSVSMNMLLICIGLIIMFVSMFITIFIYKRKEF